MGNNSYCTAISRGMSFNKFARDFVFGQIDARDAGLAREEVDERFGREIAERNQCLDDLGAAMMLLIKAFGQLMRINEPRVDEQFANASSCDSI